MTRRRQGKSATEYMLLLASLVVAVVAGGYSFVPVFESGVNALATDVSEVLVTGKIGGTGSARGDSDSSCYYTYDPRTGRWHDTSHDYLMVTNATARDAGCY